MYWPSIIQVDITHGLFDIVSLSVSLLLGATAVFSLWLSRKALQKTEFDSGMSTAPSIVIRPRDIWVGTKEQAHYGGYGVVQTGNILKKHNYHEVVFNIEFECLNAGRGMAFNISQMKSKGLLPSTFRSNKTPLYLGVDEEPFFISVEQKGRFEEFYNSADREVSVAVTLLYTNDQNNIFCKSTWQANVKPFEKEGENLKVREVRLLQRSGKIEYSQKPFEK